MFKPVEVAGSIWKDAGGTATKKSPKTANESDNPMVCTFLCSRDPECKAVHYHQATKLCHLYETVDPVPCPSDMSAPILNYFLQDSLIVGPQTGLKVATASSFFLSSFLRDSYSPWMAIDGSTVWDWGNNGLWHSDDENYPWFAIDLVSPQKVPDNINK